jgi:peptide subunit release factor 1 (eRF1)
MKLLSRDQIESLSKFKSENFLTTSFFLDTDKSRYTKKELTVSLKNLLSRGKAQLEAMDLSKEKRDSLGKDLEKISLTLSQGLGVYNFPGLAIFSCHGQNFRQEFNLPEAPRNRIIFDHNPYVRPLSAILEEHNHICAFLIEHREARWYDIFAGDIALIESLTSDVPSKVKEGGWGGTEQKRIERHVAARLRDHFKNAARRTFDLLKKNQFEWLFLGCPDGYFSELEPLLHPYLKSRLKGRLKSKPADSPDKILREAVELRKDLKKTEENELVLKLVTELEKGGRGVSGLKPTLQSLNRGGVQILVVTRSFSKEGRICPQEKLLYVDELRCPSCQRKTKAVVDVIDEAVELAMDKKCQVKHVTAPTRLDRYGKIGAFLRYKD